MSYFTSFAFHWIYVLSSECIKKSKEFCLKIDIIIYYRSMAIVIEYIKLERWGRNIL